MTKLLEPQTHRYLWWHLIYRKKCNQFYEIIVVPNNIYLQIGSFWYKPFLFNSWCVKWLMYTHGIIFVSTTFPGPSWTDIGTVRNELNYRALRIIHILVKCELFTGTHCTMYRLLLHTTKVNFERFISILENIEATLVEPLMNHPHLSSIPAPLCERKWHYELFLSWKQPVQGA